MSERKAPVESDREPQLTTWSRAKARPRHIWEWINSYTQVCKRCALQRRVVKICEEREGVLAVWRLGWEYRRNSESEWRALRGRKRVPRCPGKGGGPR